MAFPNLTPRELQDEPEKGADGPGLARIPDAMLEACRSASLLMGGPSLTRLGISSALRQEGRTSIALAFAAIHREDYGRSVVLVDLDLENPTLAPRHGLDPWPGIAEVVRGEVRLEEALQPVADGIRLVTRGIIKEGTARAASEIVKSSFLAEAAHHADVIIADLPPLLGPGPGRAVSRAFDEILLVVRAGVTPAARAREAAGDLPTAPNVLLNGSYSSMPGWIRRLLGK